MVLISSTSERRKIESNLEQTRGFGPGTENWEFWENKSNRVIHIGKIGCLIVNCPKFALDNPMAVEKSGSQTQVQNLKQKRQYVCPEGVFKFYDKNAILVF